VPRLEFNQTDSHRGRRVGGVPRLPAVHRPGERAQRRQAADVSGGSAHGRAGFVHAREDGAGPEVVDAVDGVFDDPGHGADCLPRGPGGAGAAAHVAHGLGVDTAHGHRSDAHRASQPAGLFPGPGREKQDKIEVIPC